MIVRTGYYADKPGATGITFSRRAIQGALGNHAMKRQIAAGEFIGTYLDRDPDQIANVNKESATHVVRDIRLQGDEVVVDLEILGTPNGKRITEMLAAGNSIVARLIVEVPMKMPVNKIVNEMKIHRVQIETGKPK
jgi:hypothetical protein